MWICLTNAFLSIVSKDCKPDELMVRARRPGDIERVFPEAKVEVKDGTDYQFRARIKREVVAQALAAQVAGIGYSNFKGATRDDRLHDAYNRMWHAHAALQPTRPYADRKPATKRRRPGLEGCPL